LCLLAKSIDEKIMLARENIVKEAETDGPVVRKSDAFLTRPLGIHRIGRLEHGQVTHSISERTVEGFQQQFCRIARITLHASLRGFVVTIDLRSVPPSGYSVECGFRRSRQVLLSCVGKRRRRAVLGDITFVDAIVRPAAEPL